MLLTYQWRNWPILVVVAALSLSTVVSAQTRNGSIAGTISDNTGGALPGVSVTVQSPALQVTQLVTVSDSNGQYQFPDVPIGTYQLTFTLSGFTGLVRQDIRITSGFAARVDAVLAVATLAETITVTGQSPVVDTVNTRGSVTVSQELLKSVPTNLNHQDLFAMASGVFISGVPLSSTVGINNLGPNATNYTYGQRHRANNWIEGIKAAHETPDFLASEEVDVRTFGNSAETDLPGTNVTIVYRSGGNEFRGRLNGFYQDKRFQSDNLDDSLRAQGLSSGNNVQFVHQGGADLGGRIIRDKLWFYASGLWVASDRGLTGFAKDPGPDGVYLTADDTVGYPRSTQSNATVKLSYQASRQHKFVAFVSRIPDEDSDYTATRFIPHEASRVTNETNRHSKVEWQGLFSNRLMANALVGETGYRISYRPHSELPLTACRQYRDTGLWTGNGCGGFVSTNASGNSPVLDRYPHRKQFSGDVMYLPRRTFVGAHSLKAGLLYLPGELRIEVPGEPSNEYLLVYDRVPGGIYRPAEFRAADVPTSGKSVQNVFATYVADTWTLSRRLTVNAGLRWERTTMSVPAQTKTQGRFGSAGSFAPVDVGAWSGFAPRIGGAFDLTGDGKTVAKATFGRFNHSEFNNFINPLTFPGDYNKNLPSVYTYRWSDPDGNDDYTPGEVNLDVNGADFLSLAGPASNILNPDLRWGQTYETTASLERELMSSLSIRGLYVYKRVTQETGSRTFVNVLRPYEVYNQSFTRLDPGPDGALATADDGALIDIYDYDPAYRGANFVANQIPNVPSSRNDFFHNVEVMLSKRPGGKWFANTSLLATKNHRWIEAVADTPNSNNFPLDETWNVSYRLAGGYDLPYQMRLSTLYQVFSGTKGQRTTIYRAADPAGGRAFPSSATITLRSEPFGTRTLPVRQTQNLRLAKDFTLASPLRLTLDLDVFNLWNTNVPFSATFVSGPTFGYITAVPQPRVLRFGATLAF